MQSLSHPIVLILSLGLSLGTLVKSDPSCDDNTKLKYEAGKSYVYNVKLVSNVGADGGHDAAKLNYQLNNDNNNINGVIKTTGKAVLTALENCQYVLTLQDVNMNAERHIGNEGKGAGTNVPRTSVLFTFKNGEISGLHRNQGSSPWTNNVCRGILTMIQNKGLTNSDDNPMDNESNIMGDCKVRVYAPNEGKYTKKIHLEQCSDSANSPVISEGVRYETPLYSNKLGARFHGATLKCVQIVENDIVSSANCSEVDVLPLIHPLIESTSQLTLEKSNADPKEVGGASAEEIALLTTPSSLLYDFSHNVPDSLWEEDLLKTIVSLINSMYGDHDANKAELYLQLKEKLRFIKKFSILEKKLMDSANGDQLRIQFMLNAVRDVGTEIGTEAAVVHLSKLMMKKGLSDGAVTIFLSRLAFSRDPSIKGLKALGKVADSLHENFDSALTSLVFDFNEKKRLRNFVLGASGYAHQFCQRTNPKCGSVLEYAHLIDTIAKFTSSKQPEIAPAALHALGNVEQLPPASVDMIKKILAHNEFLGKTKKIIAFEAFRRDPCQPELKKVSRKILKNVDMSLEMRIEAYLAITRCMTEEDSKVVDKILANPTTNLSAFIASHIYNVMDSQSPSKAFMKESALGQIGVPEHIRSVHNDPKASKYFEYSTFDPIPNLGFSADGHTFYQDGISTPAFFRLNVTFDILGKSYNVFQVGASSRFIPDALPKFFMKNKFQALSWKAQMMPLFFAVDSYYRVFGTTVTMGLDVFDMMKAHEFVDQSEDAETGLWRFDFVRPFTLMEHEIEFPTLTGLPLTLKSEAAYFPMLSINHTGDPTGLGIWDLLSKWDPKVGTFSHNSLSDSAIAVKGQVSVGKGTPVQIGIQGEGKLHFNHSIGYESQKSTVNQWTKKIEFPEHVILSERLTAERTMFMEANGKLVDKWSPNGLSQQTTPNELFRYEALGLRLRGTVLNKPTESNGGPYDVMFAVEKTEESFTGYSLDITTENPEDKRKVYLINLKTNGLSTKEKIHANIDFTDVSIHDLFNNDDKPKITLIAQADMSKEGETRGLKFDYTSVGLPKSDINYASPIGELENPGVLGLPTGGLVSRPHYHIKLETSSNKESTDLLDWKIVNEKENADITLKFNGPLKSALGVVKGHLSIPRPAAAQPTTEEVETQIRPSPKSFHINKLSAKVSLDSKDHGKNKVSVDFAANEKEVTLDTTADVKGDTYKLKQVIPKSHHFEVQDGSLMRSGREHVVKAEYSDSNNNVASINVAFAKNHTFDLNLNESIYKARNIKVHIVKNGKEKPFIAELITLHDRNHKGNTIEKRKQATLYVDNFGKKQAEFTWDKNSTISDDNVEHCNGKLVPWVQTDGSFGNKCKVITLVADAIVKDQFEFVSKFSNADPTTTTLDMAGFHSKSQVSANLSTIITKENDYKVIHKKTKFFLDIPKNNEQYKKDIDTIVDMAERTLKSTSTLVKTNTQDSTTETWKTNVDGSLAADPFNGESTLGIKHSGAHGTVLNVDLTNNALKDNSHFNNNLTALIDYHGRSKIASPKKQLTWVFNYAKEGNAEGSESKYDCSSKFTSDMKLDELTQPESHEMFHHHGELNLFKLVGKHSWTGHGVGLLKLDGKEKLGYDYSGSLDVTEGGEGAAPQGAMVKFAHGQGSSPRTKLNFIMNGWLSQEMTELRNHTIFESYSLDFAPKELRMTENVHLIYKKLDTQTGNVMSLVDVDGHKDLLFHNWMDFSIKENYKTQIDNKTYHHEKDIKMSGPHISVYIKNDDQEMDRWLIDFAGGAFEERHQHKFNMRSRSSDQKGLIPQTNFNVTISRRR